MKDSMADDSNDTYGVEARPVPVARPRALARALRVFFVVLIVLGVVSILIGVFLAMKSNRAATVEKQRAFVARCLAGGFDPFVCELLCRDEFDASSACVPEGSGR